MLLIERDAHTVQPLASAADVLEDVVERVKDRVADTADQVLGKAEELNEHLRHITPDQARHAAEVTVHHVRHRRFAYAVAGWLCSGSS